ncbi:MAG: SulP family inorganic anion transporter [Anaerolineales bacterium]|nr:SulP family inorganic anion transporter [Anaerolineales bacterium]
MKKFYDMKNLRGDLIGGLVAGIVALPLALAFGVQSGLGAVSGLYGAIAIGILAAIFGGTATQASGPTGPMTVITAALVIAAVEYTGSLESALGIILITFLLGGALQIVFGLLNIAKYIKFLPYPVISGFMSGVGLIIVLLQIFPFAGVSAPKSTLAVITELPRFFSELNWAAIGLGIFTILIYYLFPRITKAVPSALVGLIVASLGAYFLRLDVPLIGDIPSGLPSLQIGALLNVDTGAYLLILEYALVLAVLGSIDSLLTSVIADNITKTKHNSNRELIGQGIGNMAAALIGGIPGAGATKGTVVNINAGGRTRLSGTIHGLFLLAVLLGLGQLAAYIPLSVLAGILIPIGFAIIDKKGFRHLLRVPKADAVVLIIVFLVTTFGSLINAVGIGVILASLLFMKRSSDLAEQGTAVTALAGLEGERVWSDELEDYPYMRDCVYIKHLYGPMFFGFTSHFQELIQNLDESICALIIRMDRVPHIDQSGLYAMEEAILDLNLRGVTVLLTGLHPQPYDMLRIIDVIPDLLPEEQLFEEFEDSIAWLRGEGLIKSGDNGKSAGKVSVPESA